MKILTFLSEKQIEVIREIKNSLQKGEVLVLPTDTVYGLVCDATNSQAVEKIFLIKKRPKNKPIGIFVRDLAMAQQFAKIPRKYENFLIKHPDLKGKITIVVRKKTILPVGDGKTIGIRIPGYPLLNFLFEKINFPLAQTSANVSGKPAPTKIQEVLSQFQKQKTQPDLVIDAGDLVEAEPSTVLDLVGEKPKILREGEITIAQIEEMLGTHSRPNRQDQE